MNITDFELRRLNYCIRNHITKRCLEEFRGMSVEAFAVMTAEELAFHIRLSVMGQETSTTVDGGPDGKWQMVRCILGLSHRRKSTLVYARKLFPEVPMQDRVYYQVEKHEETDEPTTAPS